MEREFCGFSARNLFVATYGRESDLYSARNAIADQSERKFAFKPAQIVVVKQYGRKLGLKPARNLFVATFGRELGLKPARNPLRMRKCPETPHKTGTNAPAHKEFPTKICITPQLSLLSRAQNFFETIHIV